MAILNVKNLPDDLYKRLRKLAEREHRSIAQQAIHILSEAIGPRRRLSIMGLQGLGKELWEGVDPAEHVRDERDSWD